MFASTLDVERFSGSDIILVICKKTMADTYMSGPDGRNYLKNGEFNRNSIKVLYHDFKHPEYHQMHGAFKPYCLLLILLPIAVQKAPSLLSGRL